jgi:hypothetical protein
VPWNIIFFIIVFLLVWTGLLDEYQVSNIGLVEVSDLSTTRRLNFQTVLMVLYFIRYLDLCHSRNVHLKDLNKKFL